MGSEAHHICYKSHNGFQDCFAADFCPWPVPGPPCPTLLQSGQGPQSRKLCRPQAQGPEEQRGRNHPLGVANTLTNIGDIDRPEVLQAAILHDIVEYGHATFDDLELGFGKEVANIIREVTPVEDGGSQTETSKLSQSAKELLLADNLWYLTALDEKRSGV